MDREVRPLCLLYSLRLSACVFMCIQPCIREGGLSDGGHSRSFGVLCIVIPAAGRFVRLCAGKL